MAARLPIRLRSPRLSRPAALVAAMFVLGLVGGGAIGANFRTAPYQLVALTYLDAATPLEAAPPVSILEVGGYVRVLTIEGLYRGARLDRPTVAAIFAELASAGQWAAAYPAADSGIGRVLRLTLVGDESRTIDITNPDANRTVPRSLLAVVTAVQRLSVGVARDGTPSDDFVLRAKATRLDGLPPNAPIANLPDGVHLADLAVPGGVVIDRDSPLAAAWHPYELLIVANARYLVDEGGGVWRVTWKLDLDDLRGRSR